MHKDVIYSPILHGHMNTRKGRAKFKNVGLLFNSGFSFTIVNRRLIEIFNTKIDAVMK